jgi:hypothetical protein
MIAGRRLWRGAVLTLVLFTAGCVALGITPEKRRPPCPRVSVATDADRLVQFRDGPGRDLTDVEYTARIVDFAGSCLYDDDETQISVEATATIALERGPAARNDAIRFSYFVAIPVYYPARSGKSVFPVSIRFPAGRSRLAYREEVALTIPLKQGVAGPAHEIFLGFQLTPEQLEYNRSQSRSIN